MVLGWVTAHHEHDIRVLDVHPAVRHCTPTKRGGQTGHRWAVSYSCLRVSVCDSEAGRDLPLEEVELVGICAAADHHDARCAVHHLALGVAGDEGLVASGLDVAGDPGDGRVPGDLLPLVRARTADLGYGQSAGMLDVFLEGDSLGTEGPSVDRVIRVALDVDHRGLHVLRLVPEGMNDH